jgi:hypothetical protein
VPGSPGLYDNFNTCSLTLKHHDRFEDFFFVTLTRYVMWTAYHSGGTIEKGDILIKVFSRLPVNDCFCQWKPQLIFPILNRENKMYTQVNTQEVNVDNASKVMKQVST